MEAWLTASQAANLERSLWLSREAAWWPRPLLVRFLSASSIGDAFLRMARAADPWWWPFPDGADIRIVEVLAPTPESPGSARGEFGCVPSAFDNGVGTIEVTVRDYIRLK